MRPSKLQTYMDVANVVKQRSHDEETKVGAVLVNNESGAILATGFNGFVRNTKDEQLPTTRPDKYEYIVHAEENLVANCANHGIAMNNCTLVCTLSPCVKCMRLLFQCGITTVIVQNLYKDHEKILNMRDIKVLKSMSPENFFILEYLV